MWIYLIITVLLLVAELIYFKIADQLKLVVRPEQKNFQQRTTWRGGGVIFYMAALIYCICYGFPYPWFFAGLTVAAITGFANDMHPLKEWRRKLLISCGLLLMFMELGLFTDYPLWYIIPALVVCVAVINSYRNMNKINGITGAYSFVVIIILAYLNQKFTPFTDQRFLYIILLSIIIFSFFNFRYKAVSFSGMVGSASIGLIVLFLVGKLILVTQDISHLVLLLVYGMDTLLSAIHGLIRHREKGCPHFQYVYQIIVYKLNFPQIFVSAIYAAAQAIIFAGYELFYPYRWWYLGIVILLLTVAYITFIRKHCNLIHHTHK